MAEKKKNILFDIINAIFTNKDFVESQTDETLRQNSFMINRRMSIQYPLQAQIFNNVKVNASDMVKFWSMYLFNGKFPPKWVYTAGAVKSQEKKETANSDVSATIKKAYCDKYFISMKDLDLAKELFFDEYIQDIKDFEELYKANNEANEKYNYQ